MALSVTGFFSSLLGTVAGLIGASIAFQFRLFQRFRKFLETSAFGFPREIA
jgi:hypothetical protein